MLRLKEAVSIVRLNLRSYGLLSHYRGFSSIPETELASDDLDKQVLVEERAWSRYAILNRPSNLNALTNSMGTRLHKLYTGWENNPNVGFVVLKGSGRAFCAGGDIISLYHFMRKGNIDECKRFFKELYTFIYILGTYMKPHVALLNGITMGGGAGVSIPGTYCIATEKTVFATPETLIGFHPDAGASFYLSHLPGHLGEYLALTGAKINGAEMFASGLATHYSPSSRIPFIDEYLRELVTDDPSLLEAALEKYSEHVYPQTGALSRIEAVDKCFSYDTAEEIIDAVESEAARTKEEWWASTVKRLKEVSPLSLKVALQSIRQGRFETLDQCLAREYHMSLQGVSKKISGDFVEGVRALLVEKDSAPKWDPPTLQAVSKDMVDQYLSPTSEFEPGLELPTKLREAFTEG